MIITNQNYVEKAEQSILKLKNQKDQRTGKINSKEMLTTSKIRNLLAMTADIYNEILNGEEEKLSEECCGRIDYLKIRFIYEAGREPTVEKFVNVAEIIGCIEEIKGSKQNYILFSKYMEALVAYHRFYGGKE